MAVAKCNAMNMAAQIGLIPSDAVGLCGHVVSGIAALDAARRHRFPPSLRYTQRAACSLGLKESTTLCFACSSFQHL